MGVIERLAFARAAVAQPRSIGAVAPSSRQLASAMAADLAVPPGRSVLELGPGTGRFTAMIRDRLAEPTQYLGIEAHAPFVGKLQKRFPELTFIEGSAAETDRWHASLALPPVGAIISGLPFASLPLVVQDGVLASIDALLSPGGEFRTFQYVFASAAPGSRRVRRKLNAMLGQPESQQLVLANLPPARVLRWRRADRYTTGV